MKPGIQAAEKECARTSGRPHAKFPTLGERAHRRAGTPGGIHASGRTREFRPPRHAPTTSTHSRRATDTTLATPTPAPHTSRLPVSHPRGCDQVAARAQRAGPRRGITSEDLGPGRNERVAEERHHWCHVGATDSATEIFSPGPSPERSRPPPPGERPPPANSGWPRGRWPRWSARRRRAARCDPPPPAGRKC